MTGEKISNGNFSSGLTGWAVSNPSGGNPPSNSAAGVVSFNTGNETTYGDSIEQTFSAAVGSTQTVSLQLIEDNGGNADHTFRIDIVDANGNVIATQTHTVLNNSTKDVSFDFVPTTATSTIRITNTTSTASKNTDGKVDDVSIVCFTSGTLILTPLGPRPIEELSVGDLVETRDNGAQPIRWIGSRKLGTNDLQMNPNMRPVRISAGALGDGKPATDLIVSPQHRVLLRSRIAQRMFGTDEVLAAAKHLVSADGIDIVENNSGVEYWHFLCDNHEIITANGAGTESLYTGPQALKSVGRDATEEIFTIFPELRDPDMIPAGARTFLSRKETQKFVWRSAKNDRGLNTTGSL